MLFIRLDLEKYYFAVQAAIWLRDLIVALESIEDDDVAARLARIMHHL